MKARTCYFISLCFVVVIVIIGYILLPNQVTTVVVVRHAEKLGPTGNVDLSPAGLDRAQALIDVVTDVGLTAIYTTNYCRTAQTAQPSANAFGLPLSVQATADPDSGFGSCTPPISASANTLPGTVSSNQDLADHILKQHQGGAVLIVGHSPTVPGIVAALGKGSFSPGSIGDDYDRVFVVMVPRYFGSPKLVSAEYGG